MKTRRWARFSALAALALALNFGPVGCLIVINMSGNPSVEVRDWDEIDEILEGESGDWDDWGDDDEDWNDDDD